MFSTKYADILDKIDQIDPIGYARSRNYIDGAVTYLSPYISRGVISTKEVLIHVLNKGYQLEEIEAFVKELAWRDYFQRIWQEKDLNLPIKNAPNALGKIGIPLTILNNTTGITAVDIAIKNLYTTGYMHNHCRMYVASIVCNIAQCDWLMPARWFYYHLLDGDWASNACSWQWVAGLNSSKKYYANQENISKYTHTIVEDSFLNTSYEELATMPVPSALVEIETIKLETRLPKAAPIAIDQTLPTYIYNYYNLDPLWHRDQAANRVLLIEPWLFASYPISDNCLNFFMDLAKNIPTIQVYIGSFDELVNSHNLSNIIYKEHPLNKHYNRGKEESRSWISDTITGYYPSFFAYWKNLSKDLSSKLNSKTYSI